MAAMTAIVYSDSYRKYDFGPSHPLRPVRLRLAYELMRSYGLFDAGGVQVIEPRQATDEELEMVHDREYIEVVKKLSLPGARAGGGFEHGFGPGDNPVFAGMHEAAATGAGGAIEAAQLIRDGAQDHIFHIGGGLHHALRDKASGFCIYNDPALAIGWLRHHGARVAYLDFDAHHGDGVQYAFYDDPQVLTLSFHESGMYLFPGTGFTTETGGPDAPGTSVALPLLPGTGDEVYLECFDALVPAVTRAFAPDFIVSQNGCDSHWTDPLSHLRLTMSGFSGIDERLHRLAHDFTGGRWLALGGGGYEAYSAVPRAWTILMAEMAERQLPDEIPAEWREMCAREGADNVPDSLHKDQAPAITGSERQRTADFARRSVDEIRQKVFPLLGIN